MKKVRCIGCRKLWGISIYTVFGKDGYTGPCCSKKKKPSLGAKEKFTA